MEPVSVLRSLNIEKIKIGIEGAAVYLVIAALFSFLQFQTPYLPEVDSYYHIKMAYLMRTQHWVWHTFPWAQFSLWKDSFSDGCFLFHVLLTPFTFFNDLAFGGKFAISVLSAASLTSLYLVMRLSGVRYVTYWLFVALMGGEFYIWRMNVLRPQIFSSLLLIWSIYFLIQKRPKAFALINFIYALSYVASFLPLVFAGVFLGAALLLDDREDQKTAARLFFYGMLAQCFAFVVHPYFPKNLRFFYVQNIYVMFLAVSQNVNLFLGGEFFPLDTRQLLLAHLVVIVHFILGVGLGLRKDRALSERSKKLFFISVLLWLMTFISKRFTEYAIPVSVLFLGLSFTDLFPNFSFRTTYSKSKKVFMGGLALWLILIAPRIYRNIAVSIQDFSQIRQSRFLAAVPAIRAATVDQETVFTCDWDNAPELLFFDQTRQYLVMMDPTFMYYWSSEIWNKWFNVSNGKLSADQTVQELTETFKTRVGVCPQYFSGLRSLVLTDHRFHMLYEDPQVFVFSLGNKNERAILKNTSNPTS